MQVRHQEQVTIIDHHGKTLRGCTRREAQKLVKRGKAKVMKRHSETQDLLKIQLPPPRTAFSHALLIALIAHLCFAIVVTINLYRHKQEEFTDAVAVEFINENKLPKRKRMLKPPPKRIVLPRPAQTETATMKAAPSRINETVRPSHRPLLHDATPETLNIQDNLPDVTTTAERFASRDPSLNTPVSTRMRATDGQGVQSFRQRVGGDGSDGIHAVESTGTADIGIVGDSQEKGKGSGSSESDNPFAQALRKIAEHIIATRTKDKVNVVFVLDTSASMRDNIQQVADHLYSMTDAYDEINLEYHLGMMSFSVRHEGQELKMRSLMPDVATVRRQMKNVRLSGDEYALDALIETFNYMEFHSDADKHLVLVTDEAATTSQGHSRIQEMRQKVIRNLNSEELHANVLGHTESYQRRLAAETDGLWQEIPGGLIQAASLPSTRVGHETFIRSFREVVDEIRRNTGRLIFSMDLEYQLDLDDKGDLISKPILNAFKNHGHRLSTQATIAIQAEGKRWLIMDGTRTYTAMKEAEKINFYAGISPEAYFPKANIDLVIMLDYSRSMGGKSEVVMIGISELFMKMDILPMHYQVRLIRFAEPKDAIKTVNGTEVIPTPVAEPQIKSLMEDPFGGDEHLIDAILEGLPKIPFRPNASRFMLVLTDEPTTGNFAPERAIELCQSLGVRAFIFGVNSRESTFQSTLAEETGGKFYPMLKGLSKTYPYQ